MPLLTTDRQSAVIAELKQHVTNYDLLPAEVQSSLLQGAMQRPQPPTQDEQAQPRDQAVQQRFKELMRAANIDPDHPENWKSTDYPTRYQCMDQAEAETPGHVAPTPTDVVVIEDGDLDAALVVARREHDEAVAERNLVHEALGRAQQRIIKTDTELLQFADLDDQVAEWLSEQFKSGDGDDELPFSLDASMKERSRALDRAETARGAQQRLQAELRRATANANLAERKLRALASMGVMLEAEEVATALAEAEATALGLQEKLLALAHSHLPGPHGGPATLPQSVVKAINDPRPVAEKREALILFWRIKHTALVDGAPWQPDDVLADDAAETDGETED